MHDQTDPDDILRMRDIRLTHGVGDAVAEKGRRKKEYRGGKRRDAPCGGEKPAFGGLYVSARLFSLGREPEVTRLHAHCQQREGQRNKGVDVGDDAIGLLTENPRVVRREQVAQEPHHDGADAVDGSLFGQFFEHDGSL